MLRQIARDESGMTMGLVVIMVVLIGVMGAGLLTFVQRDLEAVIEVNQGHRAFAMTSAGLEAGKTQLLYDSDPARYDGGTTPDSEWSYSGSGKTVNLAGKQVNVKIQYLSPSTTESQTTDPNYAPEVLPPGTTTYPNQRDYFKVTAQGTAGPANRRVEAIYLAKSLGFPLAYFATGNITFDGNAFSIDDVSVFSEADVINLRADRIGGCDRAYDRWNKPPWNTVPRSTTATVLCTSGGGIGSPTGVASEGTIDYQSGGPTGRLGSIDYDATTNPDFVDNTWSAAGGTQAAHDITYPFNPNEETHLDLDTLRAAAQSGQNGSTFVRRGPGDNFVIRSNTIDYPANSNLNTVYFVEFSNPDGSFTTTPGGTTAVAKGSVQFASDVADPKGIIVVVNGDFRGSPSAKTYTGTVIVRDPVTTDLTRMEYDNSGQFDLRGFVNVEGTMRISGDADSATPTPVITTRRTGTYTMDLWSWRECYNTTCT